MWGVEIDFWRSLLHKISLPLVERMTFKLYVPLSIQESYVAMVTHRYHRIPDRIVQGDERSLSAQLFVL